MSRKLIAISALIVVAALALCGCSLSSQDHVSQNVQNRLDKLDELKERIAEQNPQPSGEPFEANVNGRFRDVPYGYNRTDVVRIETLDVVEEFDNAIDFDYVEMFGYSMLPTYWFNANEQMYRGSYYMKTDEEIIDVTRTLLPQLKSLYGNAMETNYYNYSNEIIELSEAKAIAAVKEGTAYFYVWYSYGAIDVEVYIEAQTPSKSVPIYAVYVNFTNYTYHD